MPPSDLWSCLRERKFIGFAAFFSVELLATNQLYFGLPVELERSGAGVGALAVVFAYASGLTITLQWPIARLMRKAGPKIALPLGFALQSLGFASLALMAVLPSASGLPILPALLLVTGLALGNMCVLPMAMELVLEFAAGRPTGAYYGLVAAPEGWPSSSVMRPWPRSTNSPTRHPSLHSPPGSCCPCWAPSAQYSFTGSSPSIPPRLRSEENARTRKTSARRPSGRESGAHPKKGLLFNS